jgi:uridine kinase
VPLFLLYKDADADIRILRRLVRDTQERGRTVDQVIAQYHATVRPMHDAYVEPCKKSADIIVNSTGQSMDVVIEMLANHLRSKAAAAVLESSSSSSSNTLEMSK